MFETVKQAMELLEKAVGELDPERLGREESVQLFECFVKVERLGAAGKALCARQVAETDAWYQIGGRSPAHCLASVAGTTVGQACTMLQTAELLQKLPATEAAYRAGKLSESKVEEIAATAAVDQTAEPGLLSAAESKEVEEFRRHCARVRAAARSERKRHEYLYRRRQLCHWIDYEGAFRLSGRFTPESGAVIMAALEPFRTKMAVRGKNKDKPAANLADALVAMAEHSRKVPEDAVRPGAGAMVHVRVDLEALNGDMLSRGSYARSPGWDRSRWRPLWGLPQTLS